MAGRSPCVTRTRTYGAVLAHRRNITEGYRACQLTVKMARGGCGCVLSAGWRQGIRFRHRGGSRRRACVSGAVTRYGRVETEARTLCD